MKTKILLPAAFVAFAAFFLTGCIIVNVEKNAPDSKPATAGSCMSTNAVTSSTNAVVMPDK